MIGFRASHVVLVVKNPPANVGDRREVRLIPGLGRYTREGNGNPLQYSCQKNPMDRGAWQATVHSVSKSQMQLKWLSMPTQEEIYPLWLILIYWLSLQVTFHQNYLFKYLFGFYCNNYLYLIVIIIWNYDVIKTYILPLSLVFGTELQKLWKFPEW